MNKNNKNTKYVDSYFMFFYYIDTYLKRQSLSLKLLYIIIIKSIVSSIIVNLFFFDIYNHIFYPSSRTGGFLRPLVPCGTMLRGRVALVSLSKMNFAQYTNKSNIFHLLNRSSPSSISFFVIIFFTLSLIRQFS